MASPSLLLAGGLFAFVVILTLIRPPVPSHPQLEFRTPDGLTGQLILSAQPSVGFCKDVGSPIVRALETACPSCEVTPVRCLSDLSERQEQIFEGKSTDGMSVRLPVGVMLLKSTNPQLAQEACDAVARQGLGQCLVPTQTPPGSAESPTLSPTGPSLRGFEWGAVFAAMGMPMVGSLFVGLIILLTIPLHGRWTVDHPGSGVQKVHTRPAPRIGGLALAFGAAIPLAMTSFGLASTPSPGNAASPFAQAQVSSHLLLEVLLIGGLPAFVFGLVEDVTRRVGVRERLLATMASALLAWGLTGLLVQRLDLGFVDALMGYSALSLAFTAFAVAGVANAVNIIDGSHGLASGVGILGLMVLGLIAWSVGDESVAFAAFALVGATAGFFLLNYPWGRLFLGDGGAYLLGFWMAWISVMIVARNPDVSPWACLLVLAYPVTEVLYSVNRRLRAKLHPGQPDRGHLHSLMRSKWAQHNPLFGGSQRRALWVAPLLWLLAILPMGVALSRYDQPLELAVALAAFVFVYTLLHRRVSSHGFDGPVPEVTQVSKP